MAHGAGTRLTFWDEGPGLPPDVENSLFHEPVASRKHGGGFGLLLVAMIVAHIHGGDIAYEANLPRGCQFHLDFPER
jgi:nitrogen-specific signal transduction histidine kinase